MDSSEDDAFYTPDELNGMSPEDILPSKATDIYSVDNNYNNNIAEYPVTGPASDNAESIKAANSRLTASFPSSSDESRITPAESSAAGPNGSSRVQILRNDDLIESALQPMIMKGTFASGIIVYRPTTSQVDVTLTPVRLYYPEKFPCISPASGQDQFEEHKDRFRLGSLARRVLETPALFGRLTGNNRDPRECGTKPPHPRDPTAYWVHLDIFVDSAAQQINQLVMDGHYPEGMRTSLGASPANARGKARKVKAPDVVPPGYLNASGKGKGKKILTSDSSVLSSSTNTNKKGQEIDALDFTSVCASNEQGMEDIINELDANIPFLSHDNSSSSQAKGKGRMVEILEPNTTDTTFTHRPPLTPLNTSRIPLEIIEKFVKYVPRADVKNMRLVDRHFAQMVSASLFKAVIVPFNTDIYGALGTEPAFVAARGRAVGPHADLVSAVDLDIFPGFGQYIRRFGMTFDIDEFSLAHPPSKQLTHDQAGFWGQYQWPYFNYRRFDNRADLEDAADETQTMKRAFAELTSLNELSIALDGGLGWLNGPDLSIRAILLGTSKRTFLPDFQPSANSNDRRDLWMVLVESFTAMGSIEILRHSELIRHCSPEYEVPDCLTGPNVRKYQSDTSFIASLPTDNRKSFLNDPKIGPTNDVSDSAVCGLTSTETIQEWEEEEEDDMFSLQATRIRSALVRLRAERQAKLCKEKTAVEDEPTEEAVADDTLRTIEKADAAASAGLIYTRSVLPRRPEGEPGLGALAPQVLIDSQKEWLLETAWAQDAFITSYMVAVGDNPSVFANIKKLTFSRLSSRHIAKICSVDFWASLSKVESLDIKVIADHRDVAKEQAGGVELTDIPPSSAVNAFNHLLKEVISSIETIKTLSIGWVDGGEHAEGVFARNDLILPAPLLPEALVQTIFDGRTPDIDVLCLPHVESLELVNCWTTPNALLQFTLQGRNASMRKLTLTSVSLTAHPGIGRPAVAGQANLQAMQAVLGAPLNQFNGGQQAQVHALQQQIVAMYLTAGPHQALPVNGGTQSVVAAANQQQLQFVNQNINAQMVNNAVANAPPGFLNALHATAAAVHGATQQQIVAQQAAAHVNAIRDGSWQNVLDSLKALLARRKQTDFEMTFLSCGYVRLRGPTFDQAIFDLYQDAATESNPIPAARQAFKNLRRSDLSAMMLDAVDKHFGVIVPSLGEEMKRLEDDWGMKPGWPTVELLGSGYDDDEGWGKWGIHTADAPTFDGARVGGTGRFSGRAINFWALVHESDEEEENVNNGG